MSIDITTHKNWIQVTINRPDKKNAMTAAMWQSLYDCLDSIKKTPDIKLLTLKGSNNCFSAGADIEELQSNISNRKWLIDNNNFVRDTQLALEKLPIPTLAIINGACVGGGCGLALACDYRIASTSSFFSLTPGNLGLMYSLDDTRRLVNQIGFSRAKQMLMFANKINAATALDWQIVHEVVEKDSLTLRQNAIQEKMLSFSNNSIAGLKRTMGYLSGHNDDNIQSLQKLFNDAFESSDFIERSTQFLRKDS